MNTDDLQPISRSALQEPALDFARRYQAGLERVQALSGDLWTDYNDHDPGVTILQQLCFGLTDAAYRTEHKLEDLLESLANETDPPRPSLFTGDRILTTAPVTVDDYRAFVIDRVPKVRNLWFETGEPNKPLRVLVDLWDDGDALSEELTKNASDKTLESVRECLNQARGLGTAFRVRQIDLRFFKLRMEALILAPDVADIDVVAELLFRLDLFVNPPPEFLAVDTLLQEGQAPDLIFEGPRLCHGVISRASLERKPEIALNRVRSLVLSVDGVLDVKGLEVEETGSKQTNSGSEAPPWVPRFKISKEVVDDILNKLRSGRMLRWPTRASTDGVDDVSAEQSSDYELVLARLRHRMEQRRRIASYAVKKNQDLAYASLPRGKPGGRGLSRYRSIQHWFPAVYGLGARGLPTSIIDLDADPNVPREVRRRRHLARIFQLKAYLLLFEQLLADHLAQLDGAKRLLSLAPDELRTYYCADFVSDPDDPDAPPRISHLIGHGESAGDLDTQARIRRHRAAIDGIVACGDPVELRRGMFLEHLLARFGVGFPVRHRRQFFDPRVPSEESSTNRQAQPDLSDCLKMRQEDRFRESLGRDQQRFLEQVPGLTAARGHTSLSFDSQCDVENETSATLAPPGVPADDSRDLHPIQERIRLLAGMQSGPLLVEHQLLRNPAAPAGIGCLRIPRDGEPTPEEPWSENFCIPEETGVLRLSLDGPSSEYVLHLARRYLDSSWSDALSRALSVGRCWSQGEIGDERYRVGFWSGSFDDEPIVVLEEFPSLEDAQKALRGVVAALSLALCSWSQWLRSVVEVPPWQFALSLGGDRVSALIKSSPDDHTEDLIEDWRIFVEQTVADNIPAHLQVQCYWDLEADKDAAPEPRSKDAATEDGGTADNRDMERRWREAAGKIARAIAVGCAKRSGPDGDEETGTCKTPAPEAMLQREMLDRIGRLETTRLMEEPMRWLCELSRQSNSTPRAQT
ncbi:hypothetical protein [Thiocapsa marina]|uniref:Uncharacterized protein n=1 Tax=Thiocapsa marina 5811 TaxID=768671 RepID=F9U9K4_9GAMM|nr:hypothetical protein [Thiocapsa marina]EGV18802.1 hypothetical protein ThimaDRAFT_1606 [Thiocapsa marina 5811]